MHYLSKKEKKELTIFSLVGLVFIILSKASINYALLLDKIYYIVPLELTVLFLFYFVYKKNNFIN